LLQWRSFCYVYQFSYRSIDETTVSQCHPSVSMERTVFFLKLGSPADHFDKHQCSVIMCWKMFFPR
jgi:hypothetical protein